MENKINIIVEALKDKKAHDIISIDIHGMTTIADTFIIASGNSVTQTKALYDHMEETCKDKGLEIIASEGYTAGRWIILDIEGIMVHIFHRDDREFYNIERLWVEDDNSVKYN